ncbi:MAG TPA: hypothetical protein VLY03_06195 [Bacteroidota bacterium]|nr:hypothetical protein [Bacteroidota bacterium]
MENSEKVRRLLIIDKMNFNQEIRKFNASISGGNAHGLGGMQMKIPIALYVLMLSIAVISCHNDESPVSPSPPGPKTMKMTGYGFTIDNSYYKVWSDSSWEEFGETVTINGIKYNTTYTSDGNEYFYSSAGYAGYVPQGGSLILFDKPLPSLPSTLVFGKTYVLSTTFFYQGYNFTLKYEQSLQDTVSISVPCGIFNACLWFNSKGTISAGGQSEVINEQFWQAKGPSTIKDVLLDSGSGVVMVRGRVNDQGWGMSYPGQLPKPSRHRPSRFAEDILRPLRRM